MRLVQQPDPGIGEQGPHDVLAGQQHRGVAGRVRPALPGRRVQHVHRALRFRRARVRQDRRQLGAPDLHHVAVVDAHIGQRVPLARGRPGDPHLVVHLGVGIAAGQLVALAVIGERVLDGRNAQHLRGLGGVRRVQQHLQRGLFQQHQVRHARQAHDRHVGGGDLLHHAALAQHHHRVLVEGGERGEPHVRLVGGPVPAGEVEPDLGPVLRQPGAEPREHPLLVRRPLPRQQPRRQVRGRAREQREGHADPEQPPPGAVGQHGGHQPGAARHREQRHPPARSDQRTGWRGTQPQRTGVDIAGDDRQRAAPADQDAERAAGEVRRVAGEEPADEDQPRNGVDPREVGEADHDEQVPQQLSDRLVAVQPGHDGQQARLPVAQAEVEREAAGRGGAQQRPVRQQGADELEGEEAQQGGEREPWRAAAGRRSCGHSEAPVEGGELVWMYHPAYGFVLAQY